MSLTAGTATVGKVSPHSIAASATDATGGTPPYTYQWQVERVKGGQTYPGGAAGAYVAAAGSGVATRSAVVGNLGPIVRYQIRLRYIDSATPTPAVAYSNVVTTNTLGLRYCPKRY